MQPDGEIVRLALQCLIQNAGIYTRQLVGIVTTLADLTTLIVRTEIGPDGVIQLQITAARVVKRPDRVPPGGRQIVKIVLQIRVDRCINVFAPTAEMQHARAGNGHLRLSIAANAFQVAEIRQHRVIAKAQFASHAHAVGFGLYTVELNSC